ncbi:hypothetical protein OG777_11920 [Micromonospora peucetia]|uniref:hypothetical protein n=1 Tax=Micromonospora peucetia TaxID=47871 RepID=UPI002255BA68|nr:hypothetical protein [Micromonospora peucetia]MCX4387635.1 hypothetical protein [Micromonospora peucetia]
MAGRPGEEAYLRLNAWKANAALHCYYLGQGFRHVRTVDVPGRNSGALFERPISLRRHSATGTPPALDSHDASESTGR